MMATVQVVLATALLAAAPAGGGAQGDGPLQISGIYPHMAALSDATSECGIGALMGWAGRLWFITYPAHFGDGKLYDVDESLALHLRPESAGGTNANRMIHAETNQLLIGPYAIDAAGSVRVIKQLANKYRLTATMRHLTDPAQKVYYQDMEGKLIEMDVRTLECTVLANVTKELGIRGKEHFKGGFTGQGRVIVANNSYDQSDQSRGEGDGRLAEWDGSKWTIIERTAFCDITDAGAGGPIYAIGWDRRSVILKVRADGKWASFRLPKASQCYDHAWCTEWPRIRSIAGGRIVMDMHGLFYDLARGFAPGSAGGLTPIATHLRMIPDLCDWNGRLVLAADDNSFMGNPVGGQPQSNLWFGRAEDLRRFGRPAGWGGVWRDDKVAAGAKSDPFLIAGFERRVVHVTHDAGGPVSFTIELDAVGDGQWSASKTLTAAAGGYAWHVLPPSEKAKWLRISADKDCRATAELFFTSPGGPADGSPADEKLFAAVAAADAGPRCTGPVLPWAGRLWMLANVAGDKPDAPAGGLYEIDKDCQPRRRAESVAGTFANRLMLGAVLAIGPHLIDKQGNVRTLQALAGRHVTAAMPHPDSAAAACYLTAEGLLLQADLKTLAVEPMGDLAKELGIEGRGIFRGGYGEKGRMIVACAGAGGCLAERSGKAWKLVARGSFGEVARAGNVGRAVLAVGRDEASGLLLVSSAPGQWRTYRLPLAGGSDESVRPGGWPRVREVQTERLLLDCGGLFYEMSELLYGGNVWGLRPIAAHRRGVGDFCSWRGLLVLTGTAADARADGHYFAGEGGAGLWLGRTDDLWQLPRPGGAGGPWLNTPVEPGRASDPYLMTGFDGKKLTLSHDAGQEVKFAVEVDITGTGTWRMYETIAVGPGGATVTHVFPPGFSAHWVRLSADRACRATARFLYE